MAVVELYGSAAFDPAVQPTKPIDGAAKNARVRELASTVEVGATDSAGSKYHMGKVPSAARPLRQSEIHGDAITAVAGNDLDLGDANAPAGLVLNQALNVAGTFKALQVPNIDKVGKAFWELLGYAADPGGELDIFFTLQTNATSAGTLSLELAYALD